MNSPRDDLDDAVAEGDVVGPAVEGDAEGDDADDAEEEGDDRDGEAALLQAEPAAAALHPDAPAPPEQRPAHPQPVRGLRAHAGRPRVVPQPLPLLQNRTDQMTSLHVKYAIPSGCVNPHKDGNWLDSCNLS